MAKREYDPKCVSITTLLDSDLYDWMAPGLKFWYGHKGISFCQQKLRESQEFGQAVHAEMEAYWLGEQVRKHQVLLNVPNSVKLIKDSTAKIVNWLEDNQVEPLAVEKPYTGEMDGLPTAGTPDLIAKIKDKICIIDWKTDAIPKSTADEINKAARYYLQLSGYSYLHDPSDDYLAQQGFIIRSVGPDKLKPKTQNKQKLMTPDWFTVEYSDDLLFAVYYFPDLTEGRKLIRALRKLYHLFYNK